MQKEKEVVMKNISDNQRRIIEAIDNKGARTIAELQVDTNLNNNELRYAIKSLANYEYINGVLQKKPFLNPMAMRWVS